MTRLKNQVAIVTGAAQGIGVAIAEAFAREGAAVGLADINSAVAVANKIHEAGGRALDVRADVTREDDVKVMFDKVEAELGPVGILVNNADIGTPIALIKEMSTAEWERTLRLNLTGAMFCMREAIARMETRRRGNVINITSNVAKRGLPWRSAYVCAKWAMLGLNQTAAMEEADFGIRVNAICPGPLPTPHLDQMMELHAKAERRALAMIEVLLNQYKTPSTQVDYRSPHSKHHYSQA